MIEFDRLRHLWRVSPGNYTRRQLPDALAQATNQPRDTDWIQKLEQEVTADLAQPAPTGETNPQ